MNNEDNLMIQFGTPEHAIVLYFKYYGTEKIICTFINTGLGLNKHEKNKKYKYNLYKYYIINIEINKKDNIEIFLNQIYPFLIIKFSKLNNSVNTNIDNFLQDIYIKWVYLQILPEKFLRNFTL